MRTRFYSYSMIDIYISSSSKERAKGKCLLRPRRLSSNPPSRASRALENKHFGQGRIQYRWRYHVFLSFGKPLSPSRSKSRHKSTCHMTRHLKSPPLSHSVYGLTAFPPLGDVVTLPPDPRNGLKHRFSAKVRRKKGK